MDSKYKLPSPLVSFIPIILLTGMLFATIRTFGGDALSGGSQISLLVATASCIFIGSVFYRIPWHNFEHAIVNNITGVASSLLILLTIGALSGTWMISGVVPTLIYYGMQIIHPDYFLTSTCLICVLISVMTGSSWTTIATIGIALMGIGRAQGFHEGWIAGAIISGAYFGDKVSPLSETTVLAASVTETPLFKHIRYMMYTTIPSLTIALILFTFMGLTHENSDTAQITQFLTSLEQTFTISPWLLIVPVVTGIMIARKVPATITLFISTLLACLCALPAGTAARNSRRRQLIQGYPDYLLRQYVYPYRQCHPERPCKHTRNGRYDEYRMADYLCHVFRRSYDRRRHDRKHHLHPAALCKKPFRTGQFNSPLRTVPQSGYSRPVHQHHPFGKYVRKHLQETRI